MNDFLRQYFWPLITSLALLAALVNFGLAAARRNRPLTLLVRGAAGLVSLGLALFIIVGKNAQYHPPFPLEWQTVFIAAGVFVFLALWLPSYVDRETQSPDTPKTTLAERAARPARATIRLTDAGADEWVN